MAGVAAKLAVGLVGLAVCAGAWAQAPPQGALRPGAVQKAKKAPKPSAAVPAQQVTPPPPAAPLRPEQMPPSAPQVTYQDGQLSIVAQNSTLSAILTAVRVRTGAQVEMPADTVNDRVAVKLGPGNAREVLASLLHGSRFDYIVLGSASDLNAVSQIILTPHPGSGAPPAASGSIPAGSQGGAMAGGQRPAPDLFRGGANRPEIAATDEDEAAAETPQQVPPQQPEQQSSGAVVQQSPAQATRGGELAQPGMSGQQNPNQPKTPEQLLQELQRMQQQQSQPPRRPQQSQQ